MGDTSTSQGATPEPRGVGLSDPAQSAYRRKILGVIDRMRATGVGADMDLPMIAVVGSQSAGKSSLIESISGITLPRAAGTCTRCPTECRLSYSDQPWSCKVVLRKTFDKQGQPLGISGNDPFGPVITDKKEVEERIRRAQRAILNPSISHGTFLLGPDREPDIPELSFSKNCVCLELTGPDLTDLSFCDLPGLIVSVGQSGNDSDIELVRDLVKTYIVRSSCLILLTVTCETDFENQGAHHMAKQYDPDGQRTIGVLTKPDRIPSGEEENWLRFVRDEAEQLTNGWFAVKQPSTKDLKEGSTWETAREQERLFFSTTPPWSSEANSWHHRFGTHNLTESLSKTLSDLIKRRLPELAGELQNLLKETESQIQKLPAAPSDDAQGEIILLVSDFSRGLATYVEGTPDDNGIHQAMRPLNKTFMSMIRGTAPEFSPFKRDSGRTYASPNFLQSEEAGIQVQMIDRDDTIYVDDVMDMADKARSRELPDHYSFIVTKRLIKGATTQWDSPCYNLLENVYDILAEEVNKMTDNHFYSFQYGGLHQRVKSIVNDVLSECQDSALQKIKWLLYMENAAPFTLNEHYYKDYRGKFLKFYRDARSSPDPQVFEMESCEEVVYADPSPPRPTSLRYQTERVPSRPQQREKPVAQDPYDQALHHMASARAYFQVAFKRFTDMVPMVIDQELLRGLDWDRGLHSALTKGLEITGPGSLDKAKEYLQEPPDVKSRREGLLKKRERLQSAKRELQSI